MEPGVKPQWSPDAAGLSSGSLDKGLSCEIQALQIDVFPVSKREL